MRGRKPKPVEQKLREGNPGKRPLPEPLKFAPGQLDRPADLPAAAAEFWDELVPILTAAGVADRVDRASLVALCVQWERAETARRVIDSEGYFALGSMGQLVEHPALAIERQAHTLLLRFAEQYGLTAAARARIAAAASTVAAAAEAELADVIDLDEPEVVDADFDEVG